MKVIDPGHQYELHWLDGERPAFMDAARLRFVKREGEKFPGNVGSHSGTTLQEVLRACCNRLRYVAKQGEQLQHPENNYTLEALGHLREAIRCLEVRAAKRHGRQFGMTLDEAEFGIFCKECGHTGCEGSCH